VQVSVRLFPATDRLRLAAESCWMVICPLVAVKPGTVSGVEGSCRVTPASGIGLGKGVLKVKGPTGVVGGVAPVASIWAVAEPARLEDTAAAAAASDAGRFTVVW
jgi:hypothetical protein